MLSLMTLSVFALVVPSLFSSVDPIDQDGEAVYRLAIDADTPRLWHVEAELQCGNHDPSIGESHTQPSDKRWSDYVERLQITTLDGEVLPWKQTGANRWVVDSLAPSRLQLRYDVRRGVSHESRMATTRPQFEEVASRVCSTRTDR